MLQDLLKLQDTKYDVITRQYDVISIQRPITYVLKTFLRYLVFKFRRFFLILFLSLMDLKKVSFCFIFATTRVLHMILIMTS